MKKIKGTEAIEYKRLHPDVELNKHNDPTEAERFDLSIEDAEDIAREDPGLLYVEIEDELVQEWDAGDYLQEVVHRCESDGTRSKTPHPDYVEIEDIGTITAKTTDAELDEMQEKIEVDLPSGTIINNLEHFLKSERDYCWSDDAID